MCMGAAMALKVDDVSFGLASPADGGAAVAAGWPRSADLPEQPRGRSDAERAEPQRLRDVVVGGGRT